MQVSCRSSETLARSLRMIVRGSAWQAASCTSRNGIAHLGGDDEGVAQRMGSDGLGDPGPLSDPAHDAGRPVAVETAAVGAVKIGPWLPSPMARSMALAVRVPAG
jgi:hypothetical protein